MKRKLPKLYGLPMAAAIGFGLLLAISLFGLEAARSLIPGLPTDGIGLCQACIAMGQFPMVGALYGWLVPIDREEVTSMTAAWGAGVSTAIVALAETALGAVRSLAFPSPDNAELNAMYESLYGDVLIPLMICGGIIMVTVLPLITGSLGAAGGMITYAIRKPRPPKPA